MKRVIPAGSDGDCHDGEKRYEEVCTDQIWGVSVGEKGDDFETYLKKTDPFVYG